MTNAANACCVQQEWVAKNLEARMAKEGPAEIFTGEKARRDQGSRRDPKPGQNWNCNLSWNHKERVTSLDAYIKRFKELDKRIQFTYVRMYVRTQSCRHRYIHVHTYLCLLCQVEAAPSKKLRKRYQVRPDGLVNCKETFTGWMDTTLQSRHDFDGKRLCVFFHYLGSGGKAYVCCQRAKQLMYTGRDVFLDWGSRRRCYEGILWQIWHWCQRHYLLRRVAWRR